MRTWSLFTTALLFSLQTVACGTLPAPLSPKAIELNRRGTDALSEGALDVAKARFSLALEYHPRFTEAWINLGHVELERGDLKAARADFERARELNKHLPAPHHALGVWAERVDNRPLAEEHYRAALAVDPGFAPARANLGRLLFAATKYEDSREQFLRLTQTSPTTIEGWVGLTESLLRLRREGEAEEALSHAPESLQHDPRLVLLNARFDLRTGHLTSAKEKALTVATDEHAKLDTRADAYSWLAIVAIAEHDSPIAREALSIAEKLDRTCATAAYARSQLGR